MIEYLRITAAECPGINSIRWLFGYNLSDLQYAIKFNQWWQSL